MLILQKKFIPLILYKDPGTLLILFMEYIIDKIVENNRSRSKYKKWALQLLIASISLNVLLICISINYIAEISFEEVLNLHAAIGLLTLLIGLTIIYFGQKIKENKSYQYIVSLWGLIVFASSLFASLLYY